MGLEVHLEPIFGQLRLSGPIWAQLCRCGSSCFTFMPRILCTSGSVSLISTPIHGRLCVEDAKLVLEGHSTSEGAAAAKLVGQKSKGMPKISIALTKLVGSGATEAIANLSLQLFKEFKGINSHM
ncbi:hypothetical protein M0R45_020207 [Rubus argutus]|uniref:Uncharacterized protein n=1 Tax=Rubus argutus TaxID=59490 RepID=A0AAW1X9R2_RUBAR